MPLRYTIGKPEPEAAMDATKPDATKTQQYTPKTTPAEVVGFIDLKTVTPAKPRKSTTPMKDRLNAKMRRPDAPRQPDAPRKPDAPCRACRPVSPREQMTQAASELQFLKAQIKSLHEDLFGYDDLRAQVAKVLTMEQMTPGDAKVEAHKTEMATLKTIFDRL